MDQEDQIVPHYNNPNLVTFPRGFTQTVALSHDEYNLENLEYYDIKLEDKND